VNKKPPTTGATSPGAMASKGLTNTQLRTNPLPIEEDDDLRLILVELRVISTLLQIGLGITDEVEDIRNSLL